MGSVSQIQSGAMEALFFFMFVRRSDCSMERRMVNAQDAQLHPAMALLFGL